MISHFHISNFKSLVDFTFPVPGGIVPGFSCLVGLNGSGKSTVLQALDFVAHVATGSIENWLEMREWKASELQSNVLRRTPVIDFGIEITTVSGSNVAWNAKFNTQTMRCSSEQVYVDGVRRLKVLDGNMSYSSDSHPDTDREHEGPALLYRGSVLSIFKRHPLYMSLIAVREELAGLRSLELLSPQAMRRKARTANDIGAGGEKLSAFLGTLSPAQNQAVSDQMRDYYPYFGSLRVKALRSGWKQLIVNEVYGDGTSMEANHVNDGMLRVLAIIAQAQTDHSFLLFDEIENGINPALVPKLMEYLVNLTRDGRKQVMVTTHSPLILNYLDDEVAKEGVILLYKKQDGKTRSIRYFDVPENARKLKSLGPGEVFVDTDLTELVESLPGEPEPLESDPPKAAPARRK